MPTYSIADPNCPLPDALILDASLLLELPVTPQHKQGIPQQAARDFISRISAEATAGQMLILASVITLEECYFKIIQYKYEQEARHQIRQGSQPLRWHDLYKGNPSLIQNYMPILRDFRAAVQGLPVIIVEPEDMGHPPPRVEPRMFYYVEQIPILPKDAYLMAIAERLNIPYIATMDADFLRAGNQGFSIYTYP